MVKKLRNWPVTAAAIAVLATGAMAAGNVSGEELRILAWEGYADADWVTAFEKETGADVSVVFIGSDDEIWTKIKGSEGEDFDLFAVCTACLQRYIDAGLTTAINLDEIPNLKDALPRFRDLSKVGGTMRDGKVYGIPFAFDSIGLIYDTNKVNPAPTSWNVLWDPEYKDRTLIYDNGVLNFSFTALALGIANPFDLTDAEMAQIKARLIGLKCNSLSFYTTASEAQQIYQNNDVALIWANYGQQQVKAMQDVGAPVAYVNPKEGALSWLDTWVLTSGVRNQALAEKWINFVLQHKIGKELSERTGFGNSTVPTANAGEGDKLIWQVPPENPQKRTDLWNEIKATPCP